MRAADRQDDLFAEPEAPAPPLRHNAPLVPVDSAEARENLAVVAHHQ